MHYHIFNKDLVGTHVWRQTQTQTVINNFYQDDMNILHPAVNDFNRTGKMEFPIMQWIFALFHKILGSSIAISRTLSFIIGLGSVFGMYRLAYNVFRDKATAALCAWTFNWSPVFYYYTVNPLPDNFALCCGIWSTVFFFSYIRSQAWGQLVISAIFLSLATLAKLPFILYGILPLTYIWVQWRHHKLSTQKFIIILLAYAVPVIIPGWWYLLVISGWQGNGVIAGVLDNKESFKTIVDILAGNFVSILPELLVNYGSLLFFAAGFYFMFKNRAHKNKHFPLFLFWGVAILAYFFFELNMIALVHDYYLFPFLPLIFLIVSYGARHLLNGGNKRFQYAYAFALLILPVTAFFRSDARWDFERPGFNAVYYQYRDELRALLPDDAIVIAGNDESHFIALYYLDRKGFSFSNDWLAAKDIDVFCARGAEYLVTDSRADENEDVKAYLSQKIFEKGTLRVYKLQCP